jgi:RNA polymerase sigma-70 factor (ECF subfamily)
LEALYRSHGKKVAWYFRRCGVEEAVARELTQETFVNALKGLQQFQGNSKLSTWLWTIARNVLLAHLRSAKPGPTEHDDTSVDPDSLSNGESARLNLICDCVRRGFAAFSVDHPERAEVVYLAVVEGWTREELAAHLGRSLHAATEYLSQCKARLRPYIEGCDEH